MTRSKLPTAAGVLLAVLLVAAGVSAVPFGAPSVPPARAERPAPRGALAGASRPKAPGKPITVRQDAIVRGLAWSADGKILATVGMTMEVVEFKDDFGNDTGEGSVLPNMTVKLWDAQTGTLQRSLGEERHTNIMALAFSPDGTTAAVAMVKLPAKRQQDIRERPKAQVRLVDARTWAVRHTLKQEGHVSALAFSPDGTRLAYGGRARLAQDAAFVKVWDVRAKKPLGGTEGGAFGVTRLAFSRDGSLLACGDEKGKVRLFDGLSGKVRREFEGHTHWVCGVGFSPDGKALVSGSTDKTIKVWDVESGKLLRTLGESKAPLTALALSADGRCFATAAKSEGGVEVHVWDTKTWRVAKSLPGQTAEVQALAFSPDGATLAIGAGDAIRLGADTPNGPLQSPGEFKLWRLR